MKLSFTAHALLALATMNALSILLLATQAGANTTKSQAYYDIKCAKGIEQVESLVGGLETAKLSKWCVALTQASDFGTAKKVVVNVSRNTFRFNDKEPQKRTVSVRAGKIYIGFKVVTVKEYEQGWIAAVD